ncbi:MAG: MotA/TolQ/ExbB proton channel family protein [Deltaproteobacteria bacterium]|nr:MotA/TolQ/ExbB proton channel family protein [Deltaproteobacteria bacterium]
MDPIKLILNADIVVKGVILILIILSITSWAIMVQKALLFGKIRSNCEKYITFFQGQSNVNNIIQTSQKALLNPLASLFLNAYQVVQRNHERSTLQERVEHSLMRTKSSEISFLESKIAFLATTGSAAPFIGLFGTVWGIMNAFLSIGEKGATNLAVVAPGIAEALIATAIGLVAAIPAVIGYNYCVQKIRGLGQTMDQFAADISQTYLHFFE